MNRTIAPRSAGRPGASGAARPAPPAGATGGSGRPGVEVGEQPGPVRRRRSAARSRSAPYAAPTAAASAWSEAGSRRTIDVAQRPGGLAAEAGGRGQHRRASASPAARRRRSPSRPAPAEQLAGRATERSRSSSSSGRPATTTVPRPGRCGELGRRMARSRNSRASRTFSGRTRAGDRRAGAPVRRAQLGRAGSARGRPAPAGPAPLRPRGVARRARPGAGLASLAGPDASVEGRRRGSPQGRVTPSRTSCRSPTARSVSCTTGAADWSGAVTVLRRGVGESRIPD